MPSSSARVPGPRGCSPTSACRSSSSATCSSGSPHAAASNRSQPARQPIYIWEQPAGIQVYGFPALDGPDGGVKVAFFRRGEVTTPDTIDRAIRPREIEDMATHLAARLPDAAGRFLRAKACMYTNTPDEHFVIAKHPEHERVTVACGFSGHGFKFVPVVGEILADLALTGSTPHPIALFDPARAALTAPR
jgi:sarcosine oxidase